MNDWQEIFDPIFFVIFIVWFFVSLSSNVTIYRHRTDVILENDHVQWLRENKIHFKPIWLDPNIHRTARFARKTDAFAFKMKWL